MKVLGVKIDNLSKSEIFEKIKFFLSEPKFHQIATINPEFIIEAQSNEEFKNILNTSDLNIADGIGLKLAFWRHRERLKCRLTGADLMKSLLHIANKKGFSVFLAANKDGLSTWEETKTAIEKIYPDLIIFGDDIDIKNEDYQILSSTCRIVFCNFGAPHQEAFLKRQKNDKIRLGVGVGGSFDYLTNKVRRAPNFFQFLGLEWLWRFLLQPERFFRIFKAVIIFPIKIILSAKG